MPRKRAVTAALNAGLRRATGLELRRVGGPSARTNLRQDGPAGASPPVEERLLTGPVFILSSIRSGSTLLRMMLGAHSQLHAPHELHLSNITVALRTANARRAMTTIGLDEAGLEHLLWDRLLDRQLRLSGKRTLVNKTPSDAFIWERIVACWPDARFVFLLRHPLSVVRSRQAANPHQPLRVQIARTRRYMEAVEAARRALPGLTVRYEDLTADPERVTREICAFLGVPWEADMLDYRTEAAGSMTRGLGDWSGRIRSGKVQPARPLPSPEEVPRSLTALCREWGYLPPRRR